MATSDETAETNARSGDRGAASSAGGARGRGAPGAAGADEGAGARDATSAASRDATSGDRRMPLVFLAVGVGLLIAIVLADLLRSG